MTHEHWLIVLKFLFAILDFAFTIFITSLLGILLTKLIMKL